MTPDQILDWCGVICGVSITIIAAAVATYAVFHFIKEIKRL